MSTSAPQRNGTVLSTSRWHRTPILTARHGGVGKLVIATTIACAVLLAWLVVGTSSALAHEPAQVGAEGPTPGAAAMRASTKLAIEHAPVESHGRCSTTVKVRGIGDACRTAGGLFRVKLQNGSTLTTHGFDSPPPTAFNSYLVGSNLALSTASVDDIQCVDTATAKHTTLIYAYPPGQASRFGTIAPLLRQETYKMSAFLNAESTAIAPTKGLKLPLECDAGGTPVVREVQTSTPVGSDSFGTIVDDLVAQGYGTSTSLVAKDRYLVFYDSTVASGAAGTGHLYQDDTPSTGSANESGGMFAIEFRWNNTPHWDILLHEAGHNMGAVQSTALHTSGTVTSGGFTWSAGHCTDGMDIMCYSDGGSNAYSSTVCTITVFDCNRDDYFNPAPAGGSYLATHWNIAASYNQYLVHVDLSDHQAPTTPTGLAAGTASDSAVSFSWSASTDNVAVTGYRVYRSDGFGGWTLVQTLSPGQHFASISGLAPLTSYDVAVSAFDGGGNESALAPITLATNSTPDVTPPGLVTSLANSSSTMTSADLTWAPASDNIGVSSYSVWRDLGNGNTVLVTTTNTTTAHITGLIPGRTYVLGVMAYDGAGNHSGTVWGTATTSGDTLAPTPPRSGKVSRRFRRSLTISWTPSTDNVGVASHSIYKWNGSSWTLVKKVSGSTRVAVIGKLKPRHRYFFYIRSQDARGNVSGWSNQIIGSTKR